MRVYTLLAVPLSIAWQGVQLASGGRTTISLNRPERLPPGIYRVRLEARTCGFPEPVDLK